MTSFASVSSIVSRDFAPMLAALQVALVELGGKKHPLMKLRPADLYSLLLSGTTDRDTVQRLLAMIGDDYRYVPAVGTYRWSGHSWRVDQEKAGLYTAVCDALARLEWAPRNEDLLFDTCGNSLGELSDLIEANRFANQPHVITSIASRDWAKVNQ